MFIAQEKLTSNIAEYVLYMYQIEDLLRGCQFDIDVVRTGIIHPQINSPSLEGEAVKWYLEVISEMKKRGLQQKGHLFRVNEVIAEIVYLHNTLKDVVEDKQYLALLTAAEENINEFRKKSDLSEEAHLIEVCFQAMYMKLLLRLQKKEISAETDAAFDTMRIILAYLTKAYHQMKAGDMTMFEKH